MDGQYTHANRVECDVVFEMWSWELDGRHEPSVSLQYELGLGGFEISLESCAWPVRIAMQRENQPVAGARYNRHLYF
jgi:hypothetical protein